jgi:signal transduction histidine kinase
MAKMIIKENMNGDITVENNTMGGATFTITLPFLSDEEI